MNMTTCMCGNEFPTHTSAGRVQCYTCSAARHQHTASTRDLVAAMWHVLPRLSCAEIGRRMVPELSKSAVIGIAHRMGLAVRNPANSRWGPGRKRPDRRLRAHVAFGGALPSGAVTLPVLASAAPVVAATRKAPPQPPKPPADPRVKPGEKRQPWPVADDGARDRGCMWLEGSARPWVYCGQPVIRPGSAWCAAHYRRVYNRPAPFRDAATESAAA